MKVIHLNHSDISGGAARAAYRIHHSLRAAGVDSHMWVNKAHAGDWTVEGPASKVAKALASVSGHAVSPLVKTLKTGNLIIHSPAILPSQWVKRINDSDADIVHLHWVQGEMLSIADIGRIKKPIVWTLHDMWAFCGAEHYTEDDRWREGYRRDNRPSHESGFDLNRWTWKRKCKYWTRPMQIVGNSTWLTQCASQSLIMREWPTKFIYYPLNLETWRPFQKNLARELLGLPTDVPLLLFGAMGGGRDPRKGFDLLLQSLEHLRNDSRAQGMELVVFGQLAPQLPPKLGFPIHYVGLLHDDPSLRALYSAADAIVVPSRQEAFGQTASEAHACGTPVIAFNIGGLPDIVEHQQTGYLANAFDTEDLAHGIAWVLAQRATKSSGVQLGQQARKRAEARFTPPVVAAQYRAVYELC